VLFGSGRPVVVVPPGVVGMQDMADMVAGAEIAPHLARHGVNVTVDDLPAYGRVEDILRNQAGLIRADLVVMGAYRHSRSRETVFGREVGP
jgi:nucleotide-binding universal stress UspA family protein